MGQSSSELRFGTRGLKLRQPPTVKGPLGVKKNAVDIFFRLLLMDLIAFDSVFLSCFDGRLLYKMLRLEKKIRIGNNESILYQRGITSIDVRDGVMLVPRRNIGIK